MADNTYKIKVGIMGGSLFDHTIIKNPIEKAAHTIFGDPSDFLITGEISGVPVALLARHHRNHTIIPSKVNYRANIWALRMEGCTHILATTAVGSLREEIKPGDIVIPHDFIDRTQFRCETFYDGEPGHPKDVLHIPMCPAYNEPLREVVVKCLEHEVKLGKQLHTKGVVVCIEGPRFSSKAESNMYRLLGGDIVNMTAIPEIPLAKEAGLLYASIAMVTDYDCWKDTVVSVEEVKETFAKNKSKFINVVVQCVRAIGATNWDKAIVEAKVHCKASIMFKRHSIETLI